MESEQASECRLLARVSLVPGYFSLHTGADHVFPKLARVGGGVGGTGLRKVQAIVSRPGFHTEKPAWRGHRCDRAGCMRDTDPGENVRGQTHKHTHTHRVPGIALNYRHL